MNGYNLMWIFIVPALLVSVFIAAVYLLWRHYEKGKPSPETKTTTHEYSQPAPAAALPRIFPIVTGLLIAVNVFFFILEETRGGSESLSVLIQMGAIYQPAVRNGQYFRLATAMFLHIGFSHLASNMYALIFIGSALERIYGHGRFLILYFVAGLSGSIVSAVNIPTGVVAAGASGAILGVLAALIAIQIRFSKVSLGFGLASAVLSLFYNILSGFVPNSGIDAAAHLGGALGGTLLSMIIPPAPFFLAYASALRAGQGGSQSAGVRSIEHEKRESTLGRMKAWFGHPMSMDGSFVRQQEIKESVRAWNESSQVKQKLWGWKREGQSWNEWLTEDVTFWGPYVCRCGAKIPRDRTYCPVCGTRLDK